MCIKFLSSICADPQAIPFEFKNLKDLMKGAVQLRESDEDDWTRFFNKKEKVTRNFNDSANTCEFFPFL